LIDVYQVRRLVKETADDIPIIIDHFEANKQVDAQRIGMLGVSMGGYVAFRALIIEERIGVAMPIIASPNWKELWTSIRTTNILERAFREVRRRTRPMNNFFTNEASSNRIMYGISKMLNKNWKGKTLNLFSTN
jgi:cephalosporin-C deacetylase-like acetyl esterase